MENVDINEDSFINALIKNKSLASIYLKNNMRLKGKLMAHNKKEIIFFGRGLQIIRKNFISAITPEKSYEKF